MFIVINDNNFKENIKRKIRKSYKNILKLVYLDMFVKKSIDDRRNHSSGVQTYQDKTNKYVIF